jgi:hypothetical protein
MLAAGPRTRASRAWPRARAEQRAQNIRQAGTQLRPRASRSRFPPSPHRAACSNLESFRKSVHKYRIPPPQGHADRAGRKYADRGRTAGRKYADGGRTAAAGLGTAAAGLGAAGRLSAAANGLSAAAARGDLHALGGHAQVYRARRAAPAHFRDERAQRVRGGGCRARATFCRARARARASPERRQG